MLVLSTALSVMLSAPVGVLGVAGGGLTLARTGAGTAVGWAGGSVGEVVYDDADTEDGVDGREDSGGDQGRWNCPGGLSRNGLGKRSGEATSLRNGSCGGFRDGVLGGSSGRTVGAWIPGSVQARAADTARQLIMSKRIEQRPGIVKVTDCSVEMVGKGEGLGN